MKDKLSNVEKNLNEELMINTSNKAGKLTSKEWDSQQKRNEQAKEIETIEDKLIKLNKELRNI